MGRKMLKEHFDVDFEEFNIWEKISYNFKQYDLQVLTAL